MVKKGSKKETECGVCKETECVGGEGRGKRNRSAKQSNVLCYEYINMMTEQGKLLIAIFGCREGARSRLSVLRWPLPA